MSSNPAFAFVIHSILKNNKNAKLLSKAKKEEDITSKKSSADDDDIELVNENGQVNQQEQKKNIPKTPKRSTKQLPKENSDTRKSVDLICLSKPNINDDREKEKRLTMIATKGVVQLFNVVREKQQNLKHKLEEAGSSERKRVKALKEFSETELQQLKSKEKPNETKSKMKKSKKWSVLEEDFMMGAKYKDWDKEDSDEGD